jgi:hypothetical protein
MRQNPTRYAQAFAENQAAIDKAERYETYCKARKYDHRKFSKLADQAMAWNDFRVLEMVYVRDEFETVQRSEGDER